MNGPRRRETNRYTLYGALFGALFPIVAFLIMTLLKRDINLLFGIICTAPFFLGLFARFAGIRQDRISDINRGLEQRVIERTNAIQSLLDLTGQGFLSFGSDYLIRPEYSRECQRIFGMAIDGRRIQDLLFLEDTEKQDFTEGLDLFFAGTTKPEVIFDLLDRELIIGEKTVEVEYRSIDDSSVMCTLTDVTGQRSLQQAVETEARRRNLILRVASHRKYFASFIREADQLFDHLDNTGQVPEGDQANELLRKIHTFKGNAAFLGFTRTQDHAHELEGKMADRLLLGEKLGLDADTAVLKKQYYDELNIIVETLGQAWIGELDTVAIPSTHLQKIERYVSRRYQRDSQLVTALQVYRKIPLADLFSQVPEMVQSLAGTRGKRIKPVEVIGGQEMVLPEAYQHLVSSTVHIIRNMVDHGIESPRERESRNKPPEGEITIEIESNHGEHVFSFTDDGRGISLKAIEQRAREKGLIKNGQPVRRSDLLALIFRPQFSTSTEVTELSGRGVGLEAVARAVKEADGKISVDTKPNRGTVFKIRVPVTAVQEKE